VGAKRRTHLVQPHLRDSKKMNESEDQLSSEKGVAETLTT
jgi:hypothetical protein